MQAGQLALEWAAEALEVFGLTVPEFAALALVHRYAGISQRAVGERLGLSKSAASVLAAGLERRCLLDRQQHIFSPGRRALYVTRAGADLVGDAADELAVVDLQFLECVPGEAIKALAELQPRDLTPVELALRAAGRF